MIRDCSALCSLAGCLGRSWLHHGRVFFVKYIDGDSAEIRSENEKNEGFCYFEV